MSSHTVAVESIRVLAARLEGITHVANTLERIGSLEDAEREAKARRDSANAEAAQAEAALLQAQESIQTIQANYVKALRAVDDGQATAQKIIEEAQNTAAQIIADANAKVIPVNTAVRAAQDELQALSSKIEAFKAERNRLLREALS